MQLCGPQSTELDFLVDAMTEYYNIKENQELHQIREPYLGQIVAANYLVDNKWYRAEIVAIQPNDVVKDEVVLDVYFLDYGDQQFVQKKGILELRADFLSLRFQAVECFLAHIKPNETSSKFEEWDEKAIQSFEEMVQPSQWKKLISKVVTYKERKSFALQRQNQRESSPIPGVELYEENSDKSIALELVKLGYAELSERFGDITKSSVLTVVDDEPIKEEELPVGKEEVVTIPNEEKQEIEGNNENVELQKEKEENEEKVPITTPEQTSQATEQNDDISPQSTQNNLEPSSLSNGNAASTTNDAFGNANGVGNVNQKKKKKQKQQATADFLSMEQQSQTKPKKLNQDWNQMMDE